KGTAQTASAVIAGDVQAGLDAIAAMKGHFDAGTLRPLAVVSAKRTSSLASKIDPHARISPAAEFVARFSELAASAPWRRFVLEINPIKWEAEFVTAVDGLLLIEEV